MRGGADLLNDDDLTAMEQINEAWERYAAMLLPAGMNISLRQATELAGLAFELARLHDSEAVEWRKRAAFWSGYRPRN